jgi:hypothetical protein
LRLRALAAAATPFATEWADDLARLLDKR